MIDLSIGFEGLTRLDSLGRRLRVASEKQMTRLEGLLYDKVMENVSGKILQKRTGKLAQSIQRRLDLTQNIMTSDVFVEPGEGDLKAEVLELGGKGFYRIIPVKARVLAFYAKSGEKVFAYEVNHPPSRAFRYLISALEEVAPLVPEGFAAYIRATISGTVVD